MATEQSTDTPVSENVQASPKNGMGLLAKFGLGIVGLIVLLAISGAYLWFFEQSGHSTPTRPPAQVADSGDKVFDAIKKGVEYLRVHQEKDGGFSTGLLDPKPAFTALVVDSIARAPLAFSDEDKAMLDRAVENILAHRRENGSICSPAFGLDQYTTAVSLKALTALNRPEHNQIREGAKQYMIKLQRPLEDGDPTGGGVGYGEGNRVDGSNTAAWIEALKENGVDEEDEAFKNAQAFFTRLQNNPETNTDTLPGGTALDNDGGFFYRPGESKTYGETRDGKKVPKSYGLMSYAGLKSFLFTGVTKKDERVQSAWQWVRDNYTLKENRNIGPDGLYYYYLTMAKALAAYGEPVIHTSDGKQHIWADELAKRLVADQAADGSWRNRGSSRWKEDDPVMVTSFCVRTLTICHEFAKANPVTQEELARQAAPADEAPKENGAPQDAAE